MKLILSLIVMASPLIVNAAELLPRLKVSQNQHFLMTADGEPFFYLGDTAWELFHRLDKAESKRYLKKRAEQGYNVIQAVALAEESGLSVPTPGGFVPLIDNDPSKPNVKPGPNNDYWDHVDAVIDEANRLGLYVGLLPTWGDKWNKKWGVGPEIFNTTNAEMYGKWIGERYKNKGILWILGGDRPIENDNHRAIINAMAKGIRSAVGYTQLMTFHPTGGRTSSTEFHSEKWLDFNMHQTGHNPLNHGWAAIKKDYDRKLTKPVLDGEPLYEDHPIKFDPVKFGFSHDWEVRRQAWWHVLAGGCGHTYGCHNVWQMNSPRVPPKSNAHHYWEVSLDFRAANDMQHVKTLMLSRPYFTRIPDQSMIVSENDDGDKHIAAARDSEGRYAFIYIPEGQLTVTIDLSKLSGKQIQAQWYDPRHGSFAKIGTLPNDGKHEFTPPLKGRGNDTVLVLDAK